ncbi:plasmalemma vesicle associated protein a isoform X2 [Anoplopoma fimbria]|uniref:plasmalemma vesicle associated protein a isoform X2 n=1 Tax=Anoplopoma fimbria TaxID=229290 RepID=UPI0023EC7B29|nr:plasmalemma vesicle associated protein a isoform X2 [Anoplopoma fimbria]
MYSSGYSQVSKSSPRAQKKVQYHSKGKSCGYYMRIVFFFSSLIQSLIIVSLVLFLVYGKTQDSASVSRIKDLEESFSRLSIENVALRQQRKNLTNLLNSTLTQKAINDWDLAKSRYFANISSILIQDLDKKLHQCYSRLYICENTRNNPCPPKPGVGCNCGLTAEKQTARLELVESNFTQTTQRMRMEMDQAAKERDSINLEVIRLRREKSTHEKEVEFFRQKCKDDFSQSLSGIANVSKAFLEKIDSLFPSHIAFQLTCPKQRDHLEQIRTNCTSLSMEVEDKLQRYLNSVGGQVSAIQAENSQVKAENWRLYEDYRWCSTNRTGLILQHRQNLDKRQRKHDEEEERLLLDKLRLNGDIEVLNSNVKYKSKVIDYLTEQLKHLNMSCMPKTGPGSTGPLSGFGSVGSNPSFGSFGPFKPASTGTDLSTGLGSSFGSAYNKPASTGTGSSSSSTGLGSSFGSAFNKPASTGTGSSSSSTGLGSSFGSAFNKPASTGTGSSSSSTGLGSSFGSAFNKPASTGTGSSSSSTGLGSSFGSAFNKPASTGTGSSSSSTGLGSSFGSAFNKPASTGTGSSSSSTGLGSSFGSAFNKPASTGTGSSSSSTGLGSSFGSAYNKPASTGTGSSSSSTGLGSSTGSGLNKPALSGKSSSGYGSSSASAGSTGSTGSANKSGSSNSGYSLLGFGSSNSGSSRSGGGTGRGPSTGNSGGTGSSLDAGRTSGLGGGSFNVAQHLRDLQRLINPSGPEEKQDLSRMLG